MARIVLIATDLQRLMKNQDKISLKSSKNLATNKKPPTILIVSGGLSCCPVRASLRFSG